MMVPVPRWRIVRPAAAPSINTALIMDVDGVLMRSGIGIGELLPDREACIVHKQLDGLLDTRQPLRDTDHIAYRQIGDDLLRADCIALLQLGRHLCKSVGVARDQYKIIAALPACANAAPMPDVPR